MKYREFIKRLEADLTEAGIDDAVTDSRLLVMYVTGFSQAELLLKYADELPAEYEEKLLGLESRRLKREPLQYITGEQEFMGLMFGCGPECLIPRQDTEVLVMKTLEIIKDVGENGRRPLKVLDMCTGSGCIAVSIAAFAKNADVTAAELSGEAIERARDNARRNNAGVSFVQSDLFENVEGRFDVIVSNPPYITSGEISGLIPEIWQHEPMMALDGGSDGLKFYRSIAAEAAAHLVPGGYLAFEIGEEEAEGVSALMSEHGFTDIHVYKDLAGFDRVVTGLIPKNVPEGADPERNENV